MTTYSTYRMDRSERRVYAQCKVVGKTYETTDALVIYMESLPRK